MQCTGVAKRASRAPISLVRQTVDVLGQRVAGCLRSVGDVHGVLHSLRALRQPVRRPRRPLFSAGVKQTRPFVRASTGSRLVDVIASLLPCLLACSLVHDGHHSGTRA